MYRLTHCCELTRDALPPRTVDGVTAERIKFEPVRFVEPGRPVAAMEAAGTERVLFCGVVSGAVCAVAIRLPTARQSTAPTSGALGFIVGDGIAWRPFRMSISSLQSGRNR